MSLRKSSSRRNGSKSDVLPKPNARRKWTPAPSRVGLALISRLIGLRDMLVFGITEECAGQTTLQTDRISRKNAQRAQKKLSFVHFAPSCSHPFRVPSCGLI